MKFNWQQSGWPNATVNRAALRDELDAFKVALSDVKKILKHRHDPEAIAQALAQEAVTTSAIEGVSVDESVVMSSICRVLGVPYTPRGLPKDARAEGVAQMVLAVRQDWNKTLTEPLLKRWHKALMSGDADRIVVGNFRSSNEPMRVVRYAAEGLSEIRFEAPPSKQVPKEISAFLKLWKLPAKTPGDVALKCAMLHPHFESIHPFEDGNGRVGRALVAKTLAEGLGMPIILPVSTVISRHRAAYYDEINEASRSLEWTSWAAFFIPVLTETLTDFVSAVKFISAKHTYLSKFESGFSDRAKKVILRMFEDGEDGVKAGLSSAKWMRMAKVSKATAARDLTELEQSGAIIQVNDGSQTKYRLNSSICETIGVLANANADETIEGINEGIKTRIVNLLEKYPGKGVPFLKAALTVSRQTVERAVAALIKAGKIEHRGSKKTGGYFCVQ